MEPNRTEEEEEEEVTMEPSRTEEEVTMEPNHMMIRTEKERSIVKSNEIKICTIEMERARVKIAATLK